MKNVIFASKYVLKENRSKLLSLSAASPVPRLPPFDFRRQSSRRPITIKVSIAVEERSVAFLVIVLSPAPEAALFGDMLMIPPNTENWRKIHVFISNPVELTRFKLCF